MTSRSGPNRAITDGDQARSGVGEAAIDGHSIKRAITGWSTPFLKAFSTTCKSGPWRKEAQSLILHREGLSEALKNLNSKRACRKRRGSKKAQLF